ncbi:MAG TPA: glycerophosphodiester phosphodiesterase [Jatrophihabitans sp.]|nr:glycerophosphodiester phosphodiesterase [Jatrophihabitans sp.]
MLLVAHRTPATREACERVAAAGAQVFEADVQVDEHGQIVVSHYLPIGRVLHRDNWRFRWHTGAVRDPLLTDVIARVPERCLILLDLKERIPARCARLTSALIESFPDRSRFRVCGHLDDDLDTVRRAGFRTWRTARDPRELAALMADGRLPDDAVSIRHRLLTPGVLDRLHDQVPSVIAWTVNDVPRARQLRAMGVEGVTTDRLAVLGELSGTLN